MLGKIGEGVALVVLAPVALCGWLMEQNDKLETSTSK